KALIFLQSQSFHDSILVERTVRVATFRTVAASLIDLPSASNCKISRCLAVRRLSFKSSRLVRSVSVAPAIVGETYDSPRTTLRMAETRLLAASFFKTNAEAPWRN